MVIISSFQSPLSPVFYEQANTKAVLDSVELGLGTVIISERTFCWKDNRGKGFSIGYDNITLHAISTDPNIYNGQCIYIVLDGNLFLEANDTMNDECDSDQETSPSQLLLIPEDSSSINTIYEALNQCQILNPDPDDELSLEEDEDNIYEDAEDHDGLFVSNQAIDGGDAGDADVSRLSAQLQNQTLQNHFHGNGNQNVDDEQFEDAD